MDRIVRGTPLLDALRSQERAWDAMLRKFNAWNLRLTERLTQLEKELGRLVGLDATWRQTLAEVRAAGAPAEVTRRVEGVVGAIAATQLRVEGRRKELLTPQNRVAEQRERVGDALSAIAAARPGAVNRLFARGSPPVWSGGLLAPADEDYLLEQGRKPVAAQWDALREYASRNRGRLAFHALLFVALTACLRRARRRVDQWAADDPNLKRAAVAFDAPLVTAAVLAGAAGTWIYP
jgi:hypothetical protein